MKKDDRIFVAGHRGLAGSAIVRRLRGGGYGNVITRTRQELDLLDAAAVRGFFSRERPDHVFLAAAKVGGILANSTQPAQFIYENLAIQGNVIEAARHEGVKKLMFLGSSCIYPKHAPQPMKEAHLLTGDQYLALLRDFEQIHAAKQCRLPGAGRPNDRDHVAIKCRQRDTP